MRLVLVCAALAVVMAFVSRAAAECICSMEPVNGSYSTTFRLVSKSPEYADVGGQFEVTLAKESDGQISFTFENHVGVPASIHEIYFHTWTSSRAQDCHRVIINPTAAAEAQRSLSVRMRTPGYPEP